jgi:hypothetical protein
MLMGDIASNFGVPKDMTDLVRWVVNGLVELTRDEAFRQSFAQRSSHEPGSRARSLLQAFYAYYKLPVPEVNERPPVSPISPARPGSGGHNGGGHVARVALAWIKSPGGDLVAE